jgi:hypothetical protein
VLNVALEPGDVNVTEPVGAVTPAGTGMKKVAVTVVPATEVLGAAVRLSLLNGA